MTMRAEALEARTVNPSHTALHIPTLPNEGLVSPTHINFHSPARTISPTHTILHSPTHTILHSPTHTTLHSPTHTSLNEGMVELWKRDFPNGATWHFRMRITRTGIE